MKTNPSETDQVFNTAYLSNNIEHEPDSSNEIQRNTPEKTMPFSDQIGNYQRNKGIPFRSFEDSKVYIVGSGIAGLSAAYYFIRDGHIPGKNIIFLEQLPIEGGSLDGAGNATEGYITNAID